MADVRQVSYRRITLALTGPPGPVLGALAEADVVRIDVREPSLEEISPGLLRGGWVGGFSPFTHLAAVPAEPWDVVGAVVMSALAALLAAAGGARYGSRDLRG